MSLVCKDHNMLTHCDLNNIMIKYRDTQGQNEVNMKYITIKHSTSRTIIQTFIHLI